MLQIALGIATQHGEVLPTLVQCAQGDRAQANWVASGTRLVASGTQAPGDESTYLVAIRGQFTGRRAPPGVPFPRGTVMTLVIEAAAGRVLDLGIRDRYPRLEELGPVVTLLP